MESLTGTTPASSVEVEETVTSTWHAKLRAGLPLDALPLYRAAAEQGSANSDDMGGDPVEDTLRVLADVRRHLRAKAWSKARRVLVQAEPPEAVRALAQWEVLEEQIGMLEGCSRLLDKRDPDAALDKLTEVGAPLLRAEVDTQRGTAYIFTNDLTEAKVAFERAAAHDPKHYRALTNLGNVALEEGHTDEAIAAYEAALKLNEDFANAHHNLGVAYRRKGQINKSVQSIRRAQKAARRQDAEEAKGSLSGTLSSLGGRLGGGRSLRYVLYGGGAALLFWWLRAQGMI